MPVVLLKMSCFVTARKRSLGQGNMFTPVYHSVHRGGCLVLGGCLVPGGYLVQGGVWSWGGCLVPGVVPGPGGWVPGPGGVPGSGGCLVETPPQTATAAGGTHPTGMHSCCGAVVSRATEQD